MFKDDLEKGQAVINQHSPEAIRERDRARQLFCYTSQVRSVAPGWGGTVSTIPAFLTHSGSSLGLDDQAIGRHLELARTVAKLRAVAEDRAARLNAVEVARAAAIQAQADLDAAIASADAISEKQASEATAKAEKIENANADLFRTVCPDQ
ncbi:MAG: hypothetical protein GX616_26185 [Planctomycetes bacterium]|nr:hypothetical protein [Planctomycetota bacterium]